MARILIATSNRGKLRDFAAAAAAHGLEVETLPGFDSLPSVEEDADTFDGNARKKAEHYSQFAAGEIVLADDSGLEVDALSGAPGVRSARYAAPDGQSNSTDAANNARLLQELKNVRGERRAARFVCVIAAARDGKTLVTVRGETRGTVLDAPRGSGGFGYDPLFFYSALGKSFGELAPEEKAKVSHRGKAFRAFLEWWERQD